MPAETTIQTQAEVEEKMVDLPAEGASVDVELPKKIEKTINPDPEPESKEEEVDVEKTASEGEMDDYGKKVQSRIDKLTKRAREAERREAAAIQFAQGLQTEAIQLKQRNTGVDNAYIDEFGGRVKAETEEAKKALKVALDTGDIDKQVEVQSRLSRLAIENERFEATKAQREQEAKKPKNVPPPGYRPPTMPPQPQPDAKAEEWAENNEWFGKDEPMTLTSFSIHRKLVEKGIDPTSNEYYTEIDKQMRENFPHKFGDSKTQVSTPYQTVASANRGGPVTARKGTVRLTPSQVAIAKKLGVPLQEYAKYVKE